MNILVSPLPVTVDVGGVSAPVRSGHRTGIQIARAAALDGPPAVTAGVILRLFYRGAPPAPAAEALDAAMRFHRGGREPGGGRAERLFCWDADAGLVLADFRACYGIDLADPGVSLHWWVFSALLERLGPDSRVMTAMSVRAAPRPKGLTGEEARRFSALKRAWALPPPDEAGALAREALMWGDTGG